MEVAAAAPAISPSSDKQLWSKLRDRVDSILDDQGPKTTDPPASSSCRAESERGKRLKEGSELLLRGFDSVSSSLSQLSSTLRSTQQKVSDLIKPEVAEVRQKRSLNIEGEEPNSKRHCGSSELLRNQEASSCYENEESAPKSCTEKNNEVANSSEVSAKGDNLTDSDGIPNAALKKAKTLAVMMATKASYLSRELKSIKSELCFVQERYHLLEEENRRLQEVVDKGVRPEEDDLVRLQLEALLAEKSRLANENASLIRENQCLHQLVEYHQLTADVSESYEQAITGLSQDFSFPLAESGGAFDDGDGDGPWMTPPNKLGVFQSLDERLEIRRDD